MVVLSSFLWLLSVTFELRAAGRISYSCMAPECFILADGGGGRVNVGSLQLQEVANPTSARSEASSA